VSNRAHNRSSPFLWIAIAIAIAFSFESVAYESRPSDYPFSSDSGDCRRRTPKSNFTLSGKMLYFLVSEEYNTES
jgi:hypothetical protein